MEKDSWPVGAFQQTFHRIDGLALEFGIDELLEIGQSCKIGDSYAQLDYSVVSLSHHDFGPCLEYLC